MRRLYLVIALQKLKIKKGKKFADDVLRLFIVNFIIYNHYGRNFYSMLYLHNCSWFLDDQIKFNIAVELTRITFPFLLFVSLSSFFAGILNSNNKFAAAARHIILNVVLIVSLTYSYIQGLDYVKQLSYGVTIAGVIQLFFLMYVTKKFYKPMLILV